MEDLLFYILLFAIPIHTRKILWHRGWFFNEWQAIFVYGTDILILTLLFFWSAGWRIHRRRYPLRLSRADYFLILFFLIGLASVFKALDRRLAWYQLLKLFEFSFLYFYFKSYALERFNFNRILTAIVAGGVFQSLIAIGQFLKQASLGLRYLGESILNLDLNNVAVFYNSAGQKVLRAYGTTPHPNVAAAYIFLAIFALYFLWIYNSRPLKWPLSIYVTLMLGLFLTFSRTIILLFFANFIVGAAVVSIVPRFRKKFLIQNKETGKIFKAIFITTIMTSILFALVLWPDVSSRIRISSADEAVQLRVFYIQQSLQSGLNWLGQGIGNYVAWLRQVSLDLPRSLYQPVHNIYLLIYVEMGLAGLAAWLLFLVFTIFNFIRRTKLKELFQWSFLMVTLSFLAIGLFDHFLWSLQEGRLMLWLTLALLNLFY